MQSDIHVFDEIKIGSVAHKPVNFVTFIEQPLCNMRTDKPVYTRNKNFRHGQRWLLDHGVAR